MRQDLTYRRLYEAKSQAPMPRTCDVTDDVRRHLANEIVLTTLRLLRSGFPSLNVDTQSPNKVLQHLYQYTNNTVYKQTCKLRSQAASSTKAPLSRQQRLIARTQIDSCRGPSLNEKHMYRYCFHT